jgi:hypothetical protein
MCGTIDPESCIRCVLDFGIKIGYDIGRLDLKIYEVGYQE